MHSNNYTLGFVFIVTLILGTMLSFTKDSVKVLQEQNLKADVQKTILRSLNFDESLLLTNESIEQTFKNSIDAKCVNIEGEIVECNIEEVDIEKNVETLPIYIRMDNDKVQGVALPIAGKGLWSTIFGYIALNPDTDSVLGIQFYKHGETPGLGGEVEKKWFTDNFINHPQVKPDGEIVFVPKKIRDENGKIISITVIKGGVDYSESKKIVSDPINVNNPISLQVLGICSALAVTIRLDQAIIMTLAVIFVLCSSNVILSVIRNYIPQRVRIVIMLSVIASLVSVVDELLKAYLYDMSKQLSVFVGLIITNCIIMCRAEAFALKNGPSKAFLDGLGNGLGYGLIIIVVSFFRELFGAGTITLPDGGAGYVLWSIPESWYAAGYENIGLLVLSPGAFIILGLVIWVQREFAGVEEDA